MSLKTSSKYFLLIGFLLLSVGCNSSQASKVCFEEQCFAVEVMRTPEEQRKGMQHRTSMAEDEGMLFAFNYDGLHAFWMKDTLIPLDIIWINAQGEVVFVVPNAKPCMQERCPSYKPAELARYVLEIKGGLAEKMGISDGNIVEMDFEEK